MKIAIIIGICILVLISGCDFGNEKKEISIRLNSTGMDIDLDYKCEYETWSEQKACLDFIEEVA